MFQNVGGETIENIRNENVIKAKTNFLSNVFSKKYIILYLITFMTSMVGINGEFSPFSLSMFAACFSSSIPLLGVVIISAIGTGIKYGISGVLNYLLTVLVMVATLFVLKPKYNEEKRNESIKVGKNLFVASLLIQIAKIIISTFTIYDILVSITFSIIVLVFYKIFINSIPALENIMEKKALSIEEVIGTSLLIAVAVSCFGNLSVFEFSIRNILSIFLVLLLGWKNGVLIGTTSGVTVGLTLGIITGSEPIMIAAYAISGMIAGILNRFGKIGVIVGFCLGNVVLAYASNGYTVELIHFKEILIASIALLAVPKTVQLNIEEFIGNSKFLPLGRERTLTRSKETVDKLNNVSDTIQQMVNNISEREDEKLEENKQIFISELLENLENHEDNILYEDITNADGEIINKVFSHILDKQELTREDLLKIFAECNSYIVGFDDKEISNQLEDDIMQIVRAINTSYKISKANFVWMKKMKESKRNMETQLNGVSKMISGIAEEIKKDEKENFEYEKQKIEILKLLEQKGIEAEEVIIRKPDRFIIEAYGIDSAESEKVEEILTKVLKEKIVANQEMCVGNKQIFLSEDNYVMAIGTAENCKSQSTISGDEILNLRLKDGKYLVALSDGMGSGEKAKESSSQALKALENLLVSGFDKETSLNLITSSLINKDEEMFATLDVAIVDLYKGKIEFLKSGACPTYVKNRKRVQIIKSNSLPVGMINKDNLQVFDKDIEDGDIILMCSDGILDSNIEYKNKELWVKYLLEDIETNNTKKIADLVLNEAIDNNFGKTKDDMSVIVCKFKKKD